MRVDGRLIERDAEVPSMISSIKPGNETQIEVWRDRSIKKLTVKVTELKEEDGNPVRAAAEPERQGPLGLSVRPIQKEERNEV